ncbi:hypothetical protein PHYPSEUDO_007668 [Phytophthora pseudosyringae]|uniref:Uncharacterized protein n=1 Tax=Phytophthora pseudosyringae TaxID=221518 RepID=A0A8T1VGU2_9STRA|nr:hypothetical protein PHYPSEUDO_007668 [Phytophthora pseudosyringae]
MGDTFVFGAGDASFGSMGIMMPIALVQDASAATSKAPDLHEQLMNDLGKSDTSESDEEECVSTSTLADFESDGEEECRPKSQFVTKESDEEWVPDAHAES